MGSSQRVFQLTSSSPSSSMNIPDYSPCCSSTMMEMPSLSQARGEIELRNVSFAYPQEPRHVVLDGISMVD